MELKVKEIISLIISKGDHRVSSTIVPVTVLLIVKDIILAFLLKEMLFSWLSLSSTNSDLLSWMFTPVSSRCTIGSGRF